MHIVHITHLSDNKASGISAVVPQYIKSQSVLANVFWYNLNSRYIPSEEFKNLHNGITDYPKTKIDLLPHPFSNPDLVIFHGIYFRKYCEIANVLFKRNIPYIVVPHGSLTDSAIKQKAFKKKIGFILLFGNFLKKARAIQYLTKGEYKASGGKWNKNYIIIPNGCEIPIYKKKYFNTEGLVGSYIGRKSIYFKGLDLLLEACFNIKKDLERYKCKINIYGPDDNGSTEELRQSVRRYELDGIIHLYEGIYSEKKRDVLLNSDFFILTSRSEGHPVALIEALSYGIPALVTTGTNMADEILSCNAGWIAETNVSSISNSLIEIMENANKLSEYSENASRLSRKYEWSNIAKESIRNYKSLISKNSI